MFRSKAGLMKTEQLVRLSYTRSGGVGLKTGIRQSLPIPRRAPDGLRVDFFFYPTVLRFPPPFPIGAPRYLSTLHANSGRLDRIRSVEPQDFGQTHSRVDPIGTLGMPDGMTHDGFTEKLTALYEAYDVLLPAFARGVTRGNPKLKRAAQDFTTLFELLSEPPLLPYYRAVGAEFFAWVARMRTAR